MTMVLVELMRPVGESGSISLTLTKSNISSKALKEKVLRVKIKHETKKSILQSQQLYILGN